MQPLPHHYDVHLDADATGYAEVRSPGLRPLRVHAPADFDGPGDAWSPEHLLLVAVEACFLLTFRAVATASRMPFVAMSIATTGTADRNHGRTRFTEIVLEPTITVPDGTDLEKARRLVDKAEQACLISASLSTPVRVTARFVVGKPASVTG